MDIHAARDDAGAVRRIDLHTGARMSVVEYLARHDIDHQTPSLLEQLKFEDWICVLVELQRSAEVKIDQATAAGTGSHPVSVVDRLATLRARPIHEHLGPRHLEYPDATGRIG
jgi:hypothetical protein